MDRRSFCSLTAGALLAKKMLAANLRLNSPVETSIYAGANRRWAHFAHD